MTKKKNIFLGEIYKVYFSLSEYSKTASKIFKFEDFFLDPNPKDYFFLMASFLNPKEYPLASLLEKGAEAYLHPKTAREIDRILNLHILLEVKNLPTKKQFLENFDDSFKGLLEIAQKTFSYNLSHIDSFDHLPHNKICFTTFNDLLDFFVFTQEEPEDSTSFLAFFRKNEKRIKQKELANLLFLFKYYEKKENREDHFSALMKDEIQRYLIFVLNLDMLTSFPDELSNELLSSASQKKEEGFLTKISAIPYPSLWKKTLFYFREHSTKKSLFSKLLQAFSEKVLYKSQASIDKENLNFELSWNHQSYSIETNFKLIPDFKNVETSIKNYLLIHYKKTLKSYTQNSLAKSIPPMISLHIDQMDYFVNNLIHFEKENKDHKKTSYQNVFNMPASTIAEKYYPMVKNLSERIGKKIDFSLIGGNLLFDRDILYRLDESLIHMLRNSIDHGIENLQERREQGKEEMANIKLLFKINEQGAKEVIITDDGTGLNLETIKEKILSKKIVEQKKLFELTDQEIYAYIFEPNFSTKKTVSELSGRGVGMNVVKTKVESFGGRISINSKQGQGTTISIKWS